MERKNRDSFFTCQCLCQDVKYGWAYLTAGILPCILGLFWEAQHRDPPSLGSMHPFWDTKPRKWGPNSIAIRGDKNSRELLTWCGRCDCDSRMTGNTVGHQ